MSRTAATSVFGKIRRPINSLKQATVDNAVASSLSPSDEVLSDAHGDMLPSVKAFFLKRTTPDTKRTSDTIPYFHQFSIAVRLWEQDIIV